MIIWRTYSQKMNWNLLGHLCLIAMNILLCTGTLMQVFWQPHKDIGIICLILIECQQKIKSYYKDIGIYFSSAFV